MSSDFDLDAAKRRRERFFQSQHRTSDEAGVQRLPAALSQEDLRGERRCTATGRTSHEVYGLPLLHRDSTEWIWSDALPADNRS